MCGLTSAMDNIAHSSAEIEKITRVIKDIAFQTNILALRTRIHNHSTPSERFFCQPAALKNLAIHKVLSAFFRLAGQQNPSPIRHPLIMNTGSYLD